MNITQLIATLTRFLELNPQYAEVSVNTMQGGEVTGYGTGSKGFVLANRCDHKIEEKSSYTYFAAIFAEAGIEVISAKELVNPYWPRSYSDTIMENPWWFIKTEFGWIEIGWRKRVMNISYGDTGLQGQLTTDDVTKDLTFVHAWSREKAVEYLKQLKAYLGGKAKS